MVQSHSAKLKFIESVFGKGKLARNGKNFDVRCPLCAPADKTKRKLSICVEDDKNHCWTCGWGARTLAPLIKRFGSQALLAEYCQKYMPAGSRARDIFINIALEREKLKLPKDFKLLALASRVDPDVRQAIRYLESRGMTEHDLWYYRFGVSDERRWHRRIIVPSFDADGNLNYFTARAIDRDRKPKYDNPDCDKMGIVFNEICVDWSALLVLCEGPFDYVKCGENAVPLLGSDLNENSLLFNRIIAHSTPIALAFDSDMKSTKTIYAAKKLLEYGVAVKIVDLDAVKDPGDMSKEQFFRALAAARPFSWSSAFTTKLGTASQMTLAL